LKNYLIESLSNIELTTQQLIFFSQTQLERSIPN
jgi:hypothetical protein